MGTDYSIEAKKLAQVAVFPVVNTWAFSLHIRVLMPRKRRAGYKLHFEPGFADLGSPLIDRMQAS